jgi:hypothetical protein
MGPKSRQKKEPPTRVDRKENMNRSSTNPPPLPAPPIARSISNKERGRTSKKSLGLEKPSPIIRTCLEIEVACIC